MIFFTRFLPSGLFDEVLQSRLELSRGRGESHRCFIVELQCSMATFCVPVRGDDQSRPQALFLLFIGILDFVPSPPGDAVQTFGIQAIWAVTFGR